MKSNHLILGATGSIGFAFAKAIIAEKKPVTLLVRDTEKAQKLFPQNDLVEIIQGDVMDEEKLKKAAQYKSYIFHGINYPYDKWEDNMEKVTKLIIEAATTNQSTIVFPGNIYEFGSVDEITEDSIPSPTTKKGKIRLRLYQLLLNATEEKKCRVVYVRLPDFFGPNVLNGLITMIFGNAIKKKNMNWLIRSDIPHQFVYTPDAARLMSLLCEQDERPDFTLYNYGGYVVDSLNDMAGQITEITGGPSKVRNMPKFLMNLMGLFMPVMRELRENYYLFEQTVMLNDDMMKNDYPSFKPTSFNKALTETLDWFMVNY